MRHATLDREELHTLQDEVRRLRAQLDRQRETTARLAAAKQNQDAQFLKLAHEIRNPLSVLMMFMDRLVLERVPGLPLRALHHTAESLLRILDNFMVAARLKKGSAVPRLEPLDPAEELGWAVSFFSLRARSLGVELVARAPRPGLMTVHADACHLRQVLWNLLGNALKFTPRGGRVTASLDAGADGVRFDVEDNGGGMTDDALARVNDPRHAPLGEAGGLGLGLGVCRELLALYGGTLRLERAAENGTRARFTLPLREARA